MPSVRLLVGFGVGVGVGDGVDVVAVDLNSEVAAYTYVTSYRELTLLPDTNAMRNHVLPDSFLPPHSVDQLPPVSRRTTSTEVPSARRALRLADVLALVRKATPSHAAIFW